MIIAFDAVSGVVMFPKRACLRSCLSARSRSSMWIHGPRFGQAVGILCKGICSLRFLYQGVQSYCHPVSILPTRCCRHGSETKNLEVLARRSSVDSICFCCHSRECELSTCSVTVNFLIWRHLTHVITDGSLDRVTYNRFMPTSFCGWLAFMASHRRSSYL